MGWTVQVDPDVRPVIRSLDLAFRSELVEHVERIADDPVAMLHRALGAEMTGLYEYRYRSTVDTEIEFTLRFEGFEREPRRLVLVHVSHVSKAGSAK